MWFVAPESITHLFDEVIKLVLSDSLKVLTEVDDLNDLWYLENLASYLSKTKTSLSANGLEVIFPTNVFIVSK